MVQRTLIPVAVLSLVLLAGCAGGGGTDTGAAGGTPAVATAGAPVSVPAERQENLVPTGTGNTRLEKIAVAYYQLRKMMAGRRVRYRTVESLGWLIADRSQDVIDDYETRNRPMGTGEVPERQKGELPESSWALLPEEIKDLDLVAINARRLALAAATLDGGKLSESFTKLRLVADRCLPVPEGFRSAPVAVPVSVPAPAPVLEPIPPVEPAPAAPPAEPAPGNETPAPGGGDAPPPKAPEGETGGAGQPAVPPAGGAEEGAGQG